MSETDTILEQLLASEVTRKEAKLALMKEGMSEEDAEYNLNNIDATGEAM